METENNLANTTQSGDSPAEEVIPVETSSSPEASESESPPSESQASDSQPSEGEAPAAEEASSAEPEQVEAAATEASEAAESDGAAADLSSFSLGGVAASPVTEKPAPEAPKESEKKKEADADSKEEAGDESEEEEENSSGILKDLTPEQAALPWYVVHTYSGFEQMVKASLEERIKISKLESSFGNILVPQETVVELVRGQKKTSTRKFLPGYIVVQMNLDDETWHFISETPKVTGFVGNSREPMPLTKQEIENLIKQIEGEGERPKPKVHFEEGDSIKVVDGPFADFNGTVDDVKPDKGKLRVLISIFGRNTPVELDFVQVEKA